MRSRPFGRLFFDLPKLCYLCSSVSIRGFQSPLIQSVPISEIRVSSRCFLQVHTICVHPCPSVVPLLFFSRGWRVSRFKLPNHGTRTRRRSRNQSRTVRLACRGRKGRKWTNADRQGSALLALKRGTRATLTSLTAKYTDHAKEGHGNCPISQSMPKRVSEELNSEGAKLMRCGQKKMLTTDGRR